MNQFKHNLFNPEGETEKFFWSKKTRQECKSLAFDEMVSKSRSDDWRWDCKILLMNGQKTNETEPEFNEAHTRQVKINKT